MTKVELNKPNRILGDVAPNYATPANSDGRGSLAWARAIESVGRNVNTLVGGYVDMQDKEQQVRLRQQEAIQKAVDAGEATRAKNMLFDYEQQMQNYTASLKDKMDTGQLEAKNANLAFTDGLDVLQRPDFSIFAPNLAASAQEAARQIDVKFEGQNYRNSLLALRTQEKQNLDEMRRNLIRLAADPANNRPETIARNITDSAEEYRIGYGKQAQNQMETDREGIYYASAQAMLTGVLAGRNIEGITPEMTISSLRQVREAITDGEYKDELKPSNKNTLLSQIDAAILREENGQSIAAGRNSAAQNRVLTEIQNIVKAGQMPSAEYINNAKTILAGNEDGLAILDGLIGVGLETTKAFGQMTPTELRDEVNKRLEKIKTEGVKDYRSFGLDNAFIARAVKVAKQQATEPVEYMIKEQGLVTTPVTYESIVNGDSAMNAAELASRWDALQANIQKWGDNSIIRPFLLTNAEAADMSAAIKQMSDAQVMAFFNRLFDASPVDKNGDKSPYTDMITQLMGNGAGALGKAGYLVGLNKTLTIEDNWFSKDRIQTTGEIAQRMVTGYRLLNPTKEAMQEGQKKYVMPDEFERTFDEVTEGLYENQPALRQEALQEVRAYYAGQSYADGNEEDVADKQRMRDAVKATQGEMVNSFYGTYLLPIGMDEATFDAQVFSQENLKNLKEEGGANLLGLGLQQQVFDFSDVRYYYLTKDGKYLTNKQGSPLYTRVK